MYKLENIGEQIEEAMIKAEELSIRNKDKAYENNVYDRDVLRLSVLEEFISLGANVEEFGNGLVKINHRYVYSLMSGKWRVVGKSKWYYSKGPTSFYEKYVLK